MVLAETGEALSARRLSERFAAAMSKPLHNHLSGIPVIRAPEELDRSLGENIVASGELPVLPVQPEDSSLSIQVDGDRLRVEIPPPGILRGGLALLVFVLPGLALAVAAVFLFGGGQSIGFRLFLAGSLGLPLLGAFFYALSRGTRKEWLEVGPEKVTIHSSYPWGTTSKSISTQEIEEITQSEENKNASPLAGMLALGGVTLMGDRAMLTFGASLSLEDRSFVMDLVRYILARSVANRADNSKASGEEPEPPKVAQASSMEAV
jgi:hypothetical protein